MKHARKVLFLLLALLCLAGTAAAQGFLSRGEFLALLLPGEPGRDTDFLDVGQASPCSGAAGAALEAGAVEGRGGRLFCPDEPIAREEAAAITYRLLTRGGRETGAERPEAALAALSRLGVMTFGHPQGVLEPSQADELRLALERVSWRDSPEICAAVLSALGLDAAEVEASPAFALPGGGYEAFCAVYVSGRELCRARVLVLDGQYSVELA